MDGFELMPLTYLNIQNGENLPDAISLLQGKAVERDSLHIHAAPVPLRINLFSLTRIPSLNVVGNSQIVSEILWIAASADSATDMANAP